MKQFKINNNLTVTCEYQNTRSGFRHVAVLFLDGNEINRAKCTYLNRTWERYEFESVLYELHEKSKKLLAEDELVLFLDKIKNEFREEDEKQVNKMFGSVGAIAMLGDIFGKDKPESNDWKARMLKAGLPGLSLPDDWDSLDDDTKSARLDSVINELTNK